jgi:hypothetical protein
MQSFLRALAFTAVFLLLAGFGQERQRGHTPGKHDVSIAKVHGLWKAVRKGTDSTKVQVHVGDEVYFHGEGTDVHFQFNDDRLFGVYDTVAKRGRPLHLVVGQVDPDTYYYSAYCDTAKVFARGDSPPKIIVN